MVLRRQWWMCVDRYAETGQLLLSNAPVLHDEALRALVAGHSAAYGSRSDGTQPLHGPASSDDPLRDGSETKIAGTEQTVREVLVRLRHSATLGHLVKLLIGDAQ